MISFDYIRDTTELRDLYESTLSGFFFRPETMRFFKSRILSPVKRISKNKLLFVTSEKRCFDDNTRVFSVRQASIKGEKISIETIVFQTSKFDALNYLKIAKEYCATKN